MIVKHPVLYVQFLDHSNFVTAVEKNIIQNVHGAEGDEKDTSRANLSPIVPV